MQVVDQEIVKGRTRTGAATQRTENVLMPLTIKGDVSLATQIDSAQEALRKRGEQASARDLLRMALGGLDIGGAGGLNLGL